MPRKKGCAMEEREAFVDASLLGGRPVDVLIPI